jgi:cation diffusion facilitator family transporter
MGLAVNVLCAVILAAKPHFHSDHDHDHGHQHDHNMRGAYLHVVADAMTSVLAIVALVMGKVFQILWVDAFMGIVGSVVILKWAYGLCRETGWELMDGHAKTIDRKQVLSLIQDENTQVSDLHVWRVAPRSHACEIVVHAKQPRGADYYRHKLQSQFDIHHIIVEEVIL